MFAIMNTFVLEHWYRYILHLDTFLFSSLPPSYSQSHYLSGGHTMASPCGLVTNEVGQEPPGPKLSAMHSASASLLPFSHWLVFFRVCVFWI